MSSGAEAAGVETMATRAKRVEKKGFAEHVPDTGVRQCSFLGQVVTGGSHHGITDPRKIERVRPGRSDSGHESQASIPRAGTAVPAIRGIAGSVEIVFTFQYLIFQEVGL